jgi:hypothetical protein
MLTLTGLAQLGEADQPVLAGHMARRYETNHADNGEHP